MTLQNLWITVSTWISETFTEIWLYDWGHLFTEDLFKILLYIGVAVLFTVLEAMA